MSTTVTLNMSPNTRPEFGDNSYGHAYSFYYHPSFSNATTTSAAVDASNQAPPPSPPPPLPVTSFDENYQLSGLPFIYPGNYTIQNYREINLQHYTPAASSATTTASPPISRSIPSVSEPPSETSTLPSFQSLSNLKRPFSQMNMSNYSRNYRHNIKEDILDTPKPKINQDHQLLSFARLPDEQTIIDSQGCIQQINLTAQLHGMFFLSELASTPPGETTKAPPELTCYRRNLFQISGSVTMPPAPLFCVMNRGEKLPIVSMDVKVSATESVDKNSVKLIVIPWKTPPPNSPEISGQEREPTMIPLLTYKSVSESGNNGNVIICSPIAYRRLQFRIATANNGRRRELQQHFTLHLAVVGTLADGTQVNVCESSTAPIVVRGRSPRNFQARKGIPLVGSSSRGNPPELQMAMNLMASNARAATNRNKPVLHESPTQKSHELPRTNFTFDSNLIPGSQSIIRIAFANTNTTTSHKHQEEEKDMYETELVKEYQHQGQLDESHDDIFDTTLFRQIRRRDMHSSSPQISAPIPEMEERLIEKLASIYGPICTLNPDSTDTPHDDDNNYHDNSSKRVRMIGVESIQNQIEDKMKKKDEKEEEEHKNENENQNKNENEYEYDFFLFSSSKQAAEQKKHSCLMPKIILGSQNFSTSSDDQNLQNYEENSKKNGGGGFLVPSRPINYYLITEVDWDRKDSFLKAAVEGETIKNIWSRQRAWALEVPWRVQVVRIEMNERKKKNHRNNREKKEEEEEEEEKGEEEQNKKKSPTINLNPFLTGNNINTFSHHHDYFNNKNNNDINNSNKKNRKKLGKKSRIIQRQRIRKIQFLEEEKTRELQNKSLLIKEKHIRRNQAKKVRRKLRKKQNVT